MRIDQILARGDEPVFSFEFFPPKTEEGAQKLRETLGTLRELEPDFVSVTYGAGGSTRGLTLELTKWIKQDLGIEAMAHLSCVGASRDELCVILDSLVDAGIENVLALRGDPPQGDTGWQPHPGGLRYSSELAALISERYPVCVGAAAFPEVHPEAVDMASDLRFLKQKVDNGVSFLITQLFFDNEAYFRFVEEARAVGIDVPIIPGIMPITDVGQIKRFTDMCGACIPRVAARSARVAGALPRCGARAGRVVRDLAVRGALGAWRSRHPLLHAEPLAGYAGHPGRAAAAAAVGAPRGGQDGGMICVTRATCGWPAIS